MTTKNKSIFLGKTSDWWGSFGHLVVALGGFVAALGVVAGVAQYLQQVEATRAKETLSWIEKWENEGYKRSFANLRSATEEFLEQVPAEDFEFMRSNETARENLKLKLYGSVFAEEKHFEDLDHVVSFFDLLGLCIQAKLCSDETSEVYFRTSLNAFLYYYDSIILERASQYAGYDEGLQILREELSIRPE